MIFVQTFTLPDFEAKNLHRKSELCGLVHERLNSNNDYISVIWAFFLLPMSFIGKLQQNKHK